MPDGGGREKAQYTGELTKGAIKRVQSEQLDFVKNPMDAEGIFVSWTDQMYLCRVLIIGPPETPYEHGFYFFEIKYPNTYPWDAPNVKFMTGDKRVRLNPNLYVNGKVCLSILGTWSGPPWTPGLTLRTIMLSIQSLLHAHPLQNEPAFSKETGEREERYARMLSYENVFVSLLRMMEHPPEAFQSFRPHQGYFFLRNAEALKTVMHKFNDRQGTQEDSPLGGFATKYDPAYCLRQIDFWIAKVRGDGKWMESVAALEAEMRKVVKDLPTVFTGEAPPPLPASEPAEPAAAATETPASLAAKKSPDGPSAQTPADTATGAVSSGGSGFSSFCRCFSGKSKAAS